MQFLRANGYRTYIVTGGGQDFVRVYANESMAFLLTRWLGRPRPQSMATTQTAGRS